MSSLPLVSLQIEVLFSLRWFSFAEVPCMQIIHGRAWDKVWKGYWDLAEFLCLLSSGCFQEYFVISDVGCDNRLFNIQLVFVL